MEMSKKPDAKLMLAEQIFEVRYVPSGSFLDVRGYVADYIRNSDFLPHWSIDSNVVNFRDKPDAAQNEGAFATFRSAGYFAYDPETRNFFVDRAGSFWRTLLKNQHYKIPELERFGARTKVFLPSTRTFEEINHAVYHTLYSDKAREMVGGSEKDCQFIIELQEEGFEGRISGGPIHKDEAGKHLSFESKEFEKTGFFVDIDFYRTSNLKHEDISKLLRVAVDLTWKKVENIAATLGV
jgi:hypothetical protein